MHASTLFAALMAATSFTSALPLGQADRSDESRIEFTTSSRPEPEQPAQINDTPQVNETAPVETSTQHHNGTNPDSDDDHNNTDNNNNNNTNTTEPVPVPHSGNPFNKRQLTPNHQYSEKLETVVSSFRSSGDVANAAKAQAVQETGMFYWISNIASLSLIDEAVDNARKHKEATGEDQIVGLVLYDLPGRDCGAGESAGELEATEQGLARYKQEYIKPFEAKVAAAADVDFAIILEPDSLANAVTNGQNQNCATAVPIYEEGVAHAIARLQYSHVHLYIDAANGGWLGSDANLEAAAREFGKVVDMAKAAVGSSGNGNGTEVVRGFSINVSNYNQLNANPSREAFTQGSQSYDEANYAKALASHFEQYDLPKHFIVDQGRVAEMGARQEWGDWCNVAPAGYGPPPGSPVSNPIIDSIVWVKPGGESDGACGMPGAPVAGQWFNEYAAQLVRNADPLVGA